MTSDESRAPMSAEQDSPGCQAEARPRRRSRWDKTFPRSTKVDHTKVSFRNRLGIELLAD